ncbi:hypothetical protein BLNAU_20950 [Blattamonas nauphoetae]|uniref:Uncharacterized protein n=1 Tax=Blattamonas nauphoetae TaxID=2049346 RepID=A0ABQ9WXS5_9EUKA|nr:hypothetical protein BLNAU_20950 [Blattamonas nauphoetae]
MSVSPLLLLGSPPSPSSPLPPSDIEHTIFLPEPLPDIPQIFLATPSIILLVTIRADSTISIHIISSPQSIPFSIPSENHKHISSVLVHSNNTCSPHCFRQM